MGKEWNSRLPWSWGDGCSDRWLLLPSAADPSRPPRQRPRSRRPHCSSCAWSWRTRAGRTPWGPCKHCRQRTSFCRLRRQQQSQPHRRLRAAPRWGLAGGFRLACQSGGRPFCRAARLRAGQASAAMLRFGLLYRAWLLSPWILYKLIYHWRVMIHRQ